MVGTGTAKAYFRSSCWVLSVVDKYSGCSLCLLFTVACLFMAQTQEHIRLYYDNGSDKTRAVLMTHSQHMYTTHACDGADVKTTTQPSSCQMIQTAGHYIQNNLPAGFSVFMSPLFLFQIIKSWRERRGFAVYWSTPTSVSQDFEISKRAHTRIKKHTFCPALRWFGLRLFIYWTSTHDPLHAPSLVRPLIVFGSFLPRPHNSTTIILNTEDQKFESL